MIRSLHMKRCPEGIIFNIQSLKMCSSLLARRRQKAHFFMLNQQHSNSGNYILDARKHKAYAFYMKPPRTLQEAIVYFSDPDRAFEYAARCAGLMARWFARVANLG